MRLLYTYVDKLFEYLEEAKKYRYSKFIIDRDVKQLFADFYDAAYEEGRIQGQSEEDPDIDDLLDDKYNEGYDDGYEAFKNEIDESNIELNFSGRDLQVLRNGKVWFTFDHENAALVEREKQISSSTIQPIISLIEGCPETCKMLNGKEDLQPACAEVLRLLKAQHCTEEKNSYTLVRLVTYRS